MLLKQLVEYADRLQQEIESKPVPPRYQIVPIRWVFDLDEAGHFIGKSYTTDGSGSKKDKGKRFIAPSLVRTSGVKAKLLVDNGEYALGFCNADANLAKVKQRHQAFKDLIKVCAQATNSLALEAVYIFLENLDLEALELPENYDPGENVTFSVGGIMPIELPEVRAYWAKVAGTSPKREKNVLEAECLISGEYGPVMDREPVKIKGIPGGQTSGMNLISANTEAYESYGLTASQIAPVRTEYAEKYANALNHLLQDDHTHLRTGPNVYVFWTKESQIPPVAEVLKQPSGENPFVVSLSRGETVVFETSDRPDQVRETLKLPWKGQEFELNNEDAFYAASLSASGSRVVIRNQITTTVGQIQKNLNDYFQAQTLVDSNGKVGELFGIYALAASLYRDANKEMVASVPDALIRFALHNTPLPFALLEQLARRNRAEQRVTRPRAALTKMTLISMKEDMESMEQLKPNRPEVAYHLGRLLAVLENIQKSALGNINSTIVDRFYGSFSTAPASVFGRLMQSAQDHLGKLRKNKPGAFVESEKQLQGVLSKIVNIPDLLELKEQGLFSLGYYHEKASIWKNIMGKSSEKNVKEKDKGSK